MKNSPYCNSVMLIQRKNIILKIYYKKKKNIRFLQDNKTLF